VVELQKYKHLMGFKGKNQFSERGGKRKAQSGKLKGKSGKRKAESDLMTVVIDFSL
jgi:hypothetical protein